MKNKYSKSLTKKFVKRIVVTTSIYTLCFILIYFALWLYCKKRIWYEEDPLYQLLTSFGYNSFWMILFWLIGFVIIFILCLKKTLNYIDAIIDATRLIVQNNDTLIKLPDDLIEIEDKMNELKRQSIHNYELAKESDKRKNDLIAYLAHDIKTPLTSMIGYLSLLDEASDMPKKQRKKYVSIALDKSYKLEDLINELFDITRFNENEMPIYKENFNLNLMIDQIVDDFYPILKETNKSINVNKTDTIMMCADHEKLARVFNNVIKNAISYSTSKNIDISIKKEENKAKVIIENEANEISSSNLNKMFEKFYRLDDARRTKTGGAGLGLAIAKEIVKLHNGDICAKYKDGKIKFYITLPLK